MSDIIHQYRAEDGIHVETKIDIVYIEWCKLSIQHINLAMCPTRVRHLNKDYLLPQKRNVFRMSVFISVCAGRMIMNVECQASLTIYSDVMLMNVIEIHFLGIETGCSCCDGIMATNLIMTCCLLSQVGFS